MVAVVRVIIGLLATVALSTAAVACGQGASESAGGRGAGAYGANCAVCHGGDAEGASRGPSLVDPVYEGLSDADIRSAIRNGVEQQHFDFGPMPANAVQEDAQVDELIAFIRERGAIQSGGG